MNTFVMYPFFDETVNAKSIDPTKLCIQNNKIIHNRVTVSAVLPALWIMTHGFKIYLTVTNVNALNRIQNLSTNKNDTFVSITRNVI